MAEEFQGGAGEELRWVETTAYATSSGDDMVVIPHGGNPTGIKKAWNRGATDEVRSDLTVQDNAVRGFTVAFSFQNVYRYGALDLPLQQIFNRYWYEPFTTGVVTTLERVAAGNKIVDTTVGAGAFEDLRDALPCPVWICFGGATPIVGQPVIATALSVDGKELTIAGASANGITLTNVAAGGSAVVMHSGVIKNGKKVIYSMWERAQTDLEHFYVGYGMVGTQVDFSAAKGSDPTLSFTYAGRDKASATATFGTGTVTPAPDTRVFSMGSGFKWFRENGIYVPELMPQKIDWSYQSPVTAVDPAGQDGPHNHAKNRMSLSGSVGYFSNDAGKDVGDRADDAGDSSLFYGYLNTYAGVSRAIVDWLPLIQYSETDQEGGGEGSIAMTPTTWATAYSPTAGCQVCKARFTNVPLTL